MIEQHTPFSTTIFTTNFSKDKQFKSHQELTDKAYSLEKENQGKSISNAGGFQSQNFDMKTPLIYKFWFEILPIVQQYVNLYNLGYNYDTDLTSLWFNVNRKYNYNYKHNHLGASFSGIYYLDTPKNSGNLIFDNPDKFTGLGFYNNPMSNYNAFNSQSYCIVPKKGMLVLFPGHLEHYVQMNNSEEPRASIAFNFDVNEEKK